MKVKIINPRLFYKVGEVYEVTIEGDYYAVINKKYGELYLIEKSDCTIIPDETENRVPFDYSQWKEKGGRVWYGNKELHQLTRFEVESEYKYAGVYDVYGVKEIGTWTDKQLTMSAPDRVWYANVYVNKISSGHRSIEECKKVNLVTPLHILEINITKGTNKIVHTYNEKV